MLVRRVILILSIVMVISLFGIMMMLDSPEPGTSAAQDLRTLVHTPTPLPASPTTFSTPLPGNLDTVTFVEDGQTYTIHQSIRKDGIRPIYEPMFVAAEDAPFRGEELVMGVEIGGDARAYPVGVLRSREMVNDVIGGTPVLVTW
jgi:hypothetical protein